MDAYRVSGEDVAHWDAGLPSFGHGFGQGSKRMSGASRMTKQDASSCRAPCVATWKSEVLTK